MSEKKTFKEVLEEGTDQPNGLSKNSKELIKETDPEKVKEEQDKMEAEHAKLVEDVEQIDEMNEYWKKTGGAAGKTLIETQHQRKRIAELEKK